MKKKLLSILLSAIIWPSLSLSSDRPLKELEPLKVTTESTFTGAFSSRHSPSVLLIGQEKSFWLLNPTTLAVRQLPVGSETIIHGVYWDNDHLIFLYPTDRLAKRFATDTAQAPEIIPAEIQATSLRTSAWFSDVRALVDEVNPYILVEGKLVAQADSWGRKRHLPEQSGLVLLGKSRYVTSGYTDQTLRLWSLPEGELQKEWVLGRWYSSRQIFDIAVVKGRLLVSSAGGRIEERSLENGTVLWNVRPCRGGAANFHYSSHFRRMGDEFRFPRESINTEAEVHYICGKQFGTIWRTNETWHHDSLGKLTDLSSNILTVETLGDTNLVALVLDSGEVQILDRKQRKIVQILHSVEAGNPNGVTYSPTSRQLVLVGADGVIHLYALATH